jgi:hypothetical protein
MFEEEDFKQLRVMPLKVDRPGLWPPVQDSSGGGLEPVEAALLVKMPFTPISGSQHNVLQLFQRTLKFQHRKYLLFFKLTLPKSEFYRSAASRSYFTTSAKAAF